MKHCNLGYTLHLSFFFLLSYISRTMTQVQNNDNTSKYIKNHRFSISVPLRLLITDWRPTSPEWMGSTFINHNNDK